ncbi:putative elongation factor P-like [Daphnia sinensis]|uniref:Elongation factor P-like n=1 Tax=Daphnia sinensis TaxID=1820382 RepID=A0AAD5PJX9_9CRUS|nr:putative elongation factor P-like [Daphnia sinensis]
MGYNFMDTNTFEQITIDEKLIERPKLLKDGQFVDIMIHDETETPLAVELPPFVELMITYTEPGIKGDTATNAQKPATMETGAIVMVPLFVEQDTMIRVDTRDGSYSERMSENIPQKKRPMKAKEIQELIDYISNSGLAEVKIKTEEFELSIKKYADQGPVRIVESAPAPVAPIAPAHIPAQVAVQPPVVIPSNLLEIKSQ